MWAIQNQVAVPVNVLALFLGVAAPQQEHHVVALPVDNFDHLVGKLLPTLALMGSGIALLDREDTVEQ